MFQNFDDIADPSLAKERIGRLRARLAAAGVDGFIVPRADEHQGEYVAERSERLKWLTGFSGSAGVALILAGQAVIFVDGRYTIQVREQTDGGLFDYDSLIENPPAKWLKDNASRGLRLGFDPWLHTIGEANRLRDALRDLGGALVPLGDNPVDHVWADQPGVPLGAVGIHEQRFAGRPASGKLAGLAGKLTAAGVDHVVLTDPSSIAWSFNIRGSDVPHTPLVLSFAIIGADGANALYVDSRKLSAKTKSYLDGLCELKPPSALEDDLTVLAGLGKVIGLDEQMAAERLRLIVDEAGGKVKAMRDPAALPRAVKNEAEIAGTRDAHRRDGAAMAAFLCWLDGEPGGSVDEIAAASKLEACRRRIGEKHQMPLRDISFDTISGAGPNGAIIHYRVTNATSRILEPGSLYLVDSGGQYFDGTTDITRTVAIGEPTSAMRRHYTIVLKGMIAVSMMRFPPGTRGLDIDPIARIAHWKAGLDYAHGTGHGVGSYLSVHEGPQRIAKSGTEVLVAGMILSNEPGYYRAGDYGIRLENLVLVEPASAIAGGEIEMHGFATLTLAPFDRRLVEVDLLSGEERDWLNVYHRNVLAEIGPLVDAAVRDWLEAACAPV